MDGTQFDDTVKRLSLRANRRRILGGIGAAALVGVAGRSALAAQSPNAVCMKACAADAKAARRACPDKKGKKKNACLKEVKTESAACKAACPPPEVPTTT